MSKSRQEPREEGERVQKGRLECNESTRVFLQLLEQAHEGIHEPRGTMRWDELPFEERAQMGMGQKVGFVGLGAMGGAMAVVLHRRGFDVCGFDVSLSSCSPSFSFLLPTHSPCSARPSLTPTDGRIHVLLERESGVSHWASVSQSCEFPSCRSRKLHPTSSGMLVAALERAPRTHVQVPLRSSKKHEQKYLQRSLIYLHFGGLFMR